MIKLYEIIKVSKYDMEKGFKVGGIIHGYEKENIVEEPITLNKFMKHQLKELF